MWRLRILMVIIGSLGTLPIVAQDHPPTFIADGALAHNFVRKLLPLQSKVSVGSQSYDLWVSDLYFCESWDAQPGTKALVLGLINPGKAPNKLPPPTLDSSDCSDLSFTALKRRLDEQQTPIVSTLSLSWEPWGLKFYVYNATVLGRHPSSEVKSLRNVIAQLKAPLVEFSTSAIKVTIKDGVIIPLDVAISFDRNSVQASFYDSGSAPNVPKWPDSPKIEQLSSPVNALIRMPYTFANPIITKYFSEPYADTVDGGPVRFINPTVSGSQDSFLLNGTFEYQTGAGVWKPFAATVKWTGSDLQISDVTLAAKPEDCVPNFANCDKLFEVLSQIMQGKMKQKLQGLMLRPANYSKPNNWQAFGIPMKVRMEIIQSSASNTGVEFRGIAAVE